MKHSTGPWFVDPSIGTIVWQEARDNKGAMRIADIRGWGHLTGVGGLGLPVDEARAIQNANARLIAAAPDMLELLRSYWLRNRALPALDDGAAALIRKVGGVSL